MQPYLGGGQGSLPREQQLKMREQPLPSCQGHRTVMWGFSGSWLEMRVNGNSDGCYCVCFQVCCQVQAVSLPASP